MTIKLSKQEKLAQEVGTLVGQVGSIQKDIDAKCQSIRTMRKGKPVGTVKSGCAVMIRFKESQEKLGLAEQTIKNNLVTFRKAINEGKKYDVNAIRNAKRGTKSRNDQPKMVSTKSDDKKPEVVVAKREGLTSEELSKEFRKVFEKMREGHADLVAFLIDALDEFDGK